MQTQNKNILIANVAADVMNKKVYTKVRKNLLDLYASRDIYKKVRFDVAEPMARIGIRDRRTYEELVSVFASYSDTFTVDEIKTYFFNLFLGDIFKDAQVNEQEDGIEFVFPTNTNYDLLHDTFSMVDYLMNVCNVDVVASLNPALDAFVNNLTDDRIPPSDVLFRMRQFGFMRLKPFCALVEEKATCSASPESDKELITQFHPDTPFYDACFTAMRMLFEPGFGYLDEGLEETAGIAKCDFLARVEAEHIIKCSMENFNCNIIANTDFIRDLREASGDETYVNRSVAYICMFSWLMRAMIGSQKYADDIRTLDSTSLTKQEIRRIIASTMLWAKRSEMTIPKTPISDPGTSALLMNDMVRSGFELVLRKNRKDVILSIHKQMGRDEKAAEKEAKKEAVSKTVTGLERVLEENSKLKSSEQQLKQELRSKKDIEKKMKGEMSDMKKDLEAQMKKLRKELEKVKAEKAELEKQLDDDEFASDDETIITKEDVLFVAEGKTVLVWGIRPEIAERLTSEYPGIVNCIIMEDGRQNCSIPSGALDKCDAAIIVTNYSSHGMYYKARDEIKASGVPYAHARKNVNSPDRFGRLMWKVLTGTDNRNIDE